MPAIPKISAQYGPALRLAIAQQSVPLLASAFILDGGVLLRAVLFSGIAHWILICVILLRRPSSPTRFDISAIRIGFLPMIVFAGAIAAFVSRTL